MMMSRPMMLTIFAVTSMVCGEHMCKSDREREPPIGMPDSARLGSHHSLTRDVEAGRVSMRACTVHMLHMLEGESAAAERVARTLTLTPHTSHGRVATEWWSVDDDAMDPVLEEWAIAQEGVFGAEYVRVFGKRDGVQKGVKTQRSSQVWPRDRRGYKTAVRLHRWLALCVHGAPPPRRTHASHVCGNALCVRASHIRWQTRRENLVLDRAFHRKHHRVESRPHRTSRRPMVRFSRLWWPAYTQGTPGARLVQAEAKP